jgi:MFS transporter, DHA1 family, inner membrane transport protein
MIGTSVVAPERVGRAMSIVLSGFAVSTAAGVPIGTVIGHELGWRGAFAAVLLLATAVLVAAVALIPSTPSAGGGAAGQARSAFAPRVLAMLGLFCLVFAAVSSVMTYLIPFLHEVTGVSGALVSGFLVAWGAATLIGSIAGGRWADTHAARTLVIGTAGLSVAPLALYLVGSSPVLVVVVVLVWGVCAFGTTPAMQFRVVSLAGPGGALASSLPASAANAGVALGSVAGGVTIDVVGVRAVTLTGLAIGVVAVLGAVLTRSLRPPAPITSAACCSGSRSGSPHRCSPARRALRPRRSRTGWSAACRRGTGAGR